MRTALPLLLLLHIIATAGVIADGPWYDYSAYTECKAHPEAPLYNGGVMVDQDGGIPMVYRKTEAGIYSPAFVLYNLTATTRYSFSCWVRISKGAASALVRATLSAEGSSLHCLGTVLARNGCWSFLKGGFVLDSSSTSSILYFQNMDDKMTEISVASASLQPFSVEQWSNHQQESIRTKRKRTVTIHVTDKQGNQIAGASVSVQQSSKEFPFGSAIASSILGNKQYQDWFVERFNAAVFENELKWYATEPEPGKFNYKLADEMLGFVTSNQILARGHNIFWEDPIYTPSWVRNLTGDGLQAAVKARIESLLTRYRGQFVHWDVSNEMLHFDFYEQRLGENASMEFFHTAQRADPLATLFMNEFNVVETCSDPKSTVDAYTSRLKQLKDGGAILEGIGLEGHFGRPNVPLMRAVLDKLAALELPIWLTEIDISRSVGQQNQAMYLEEVLREGFAYPSVSGIVLWTAMHQDGSCYQMCLTDQSMNNLPPGDVVDKLLEEWKTDEGGVTDEHGQFSFGGFLGEYKVSVVEGNRSMETILFLSRGDETKHVGVQL